MAAKVYHFTSVGDSFIVHLLGMEILLTQCELRIAIVLKNSMVTTLSLIFLMFFSWQRFRFNYRSSPTVSPQFKAYEILLKWNVLIPLAVQPFIINWVKMVLIRNINKNTIAAQNRKKYLAQKSFTQLWKLIVIFFSCISNTVKTLVIHWMIQASKDGLVHKYHRNTLNYG